MNTQIRFNWNLQEIADEQKKCDFVKQTKEDGKLQTKEVNNFSLYFDEKNRLIIPVNLTDKILKELHSYLQHPGRTTFYETLKNYVKINKLNKRISTIILSCADCQENKLFKTQNGKIGGNLFSDEPMNSICTDILGPLQTEHFVTTLKQSQFYILTMCDLCTRWTEVAILKDITSASLIRELEKGWIRKHDLPRKLLSDRGVQYTSNTFEDWCAERNVQHILTSPYNPSCNGLAERINQQIADVLRINRGQKLENLPELIGRKLNY